MAGGNQCNAVVFGAVSQNPDGRPGADPDTENAGGPGCKILRFQKEKYYTVGIQSGSLKADSGRIADAETANSLKEKCTGTTTVCTSVKREKKTEQPPKLYDLTTLQREANRVFGYTAKQTLDYAQSLYEKKLLTYPRTDSRYLTVDMTETASVVLHLAARVPPFDAARSFSPMLRRW